MNKYVITAVTAMKGHTNGGIVYMLPTVLVRLAYLLPLMFLWRVIAEGGVDAGMTLAQLLTYTYISALLSEMLVVRTPASDWCFTGQLVTLYTKPFSTVGQIISHTIGGWLPLLLVFSLPMTILATFLGIGIIPATIWFFPSLLLCISLGFAFDLIFTCVTVRMRGQSWLVYSIRMAIAALFSGTMIPFQILPFGLAAFFELQPFGSLGGAPLSLFVGTAQASRIIIMQIFWNLILWPIAILWFKKSKERQVGYGG